MTDDDIKTAVFKILRKIAPESPPDQIDTKENLREALDIDSFDFLNLMIGLNEELKIEIPETDYRNIGTLGELVRYLSERLK